MDNGIFPDWVEYGFGDRHRAPPLETVIVKQIHSNHVLRDDGVSALLGRGDAIVSDYPGRRLAIRTADCLPILIADAGRRAVAAVHAGWRGTVDNIAGAAVAALREAFGSRPEDLVVALGPGIAACCFEVGPEVAVQFRGLFPERADLDGRTRIDLVEANRRQLLAAGVAQANLRLAAEPACTACHPERYHSYRRDREASGRMVSFIGIRG